MPWEPQLEQTNVLYKLMTGSAIIARNFERRIIDLANEPYIKDTPKSRLSILRHYKDIVMLNKEHSHKARLELILRGRLNATD